MPCSKRFLQQAWLIGGKWRVRIQYASDVPPSTDSAHGERQARMSSCFLGLWAKQAAQWPYYGQAGSYWYRQTLAVTVACWRKLTRQVECFSRVSRALNS